MTVAGQVFHPVAVLAQVVLNEVEMHAREELGVNLRLEAFFEFWEAHAKTSFLK